MEELDGVVEHLFAVRLVEDLVLGALVDLLLGARAADLLDRDARLFERRQRVLGAVDPQHREVAE